MAVQFRNLTTSWHDPIGQWPYEAVVTTIERGLVSDWRPVLVELRQHPFGRIAGYVSHYAKDPDDKAAGAFFAEALRRARLAQEERERGEVTSRIRAAIAATGLSQGEFAKRIGTSPSRLSTYVTGHVIPSAAMLIRIEDLASTYRARTVSENTPGS